MQHAIRYTLVLALFAAALPALAHKPTTPPPTQPPAQHQEQGQSQHQGQAQGQGQAQSSTNNNTNSSTSSSGSTSNATGGNANAAGGSSNATAIGGAAGDASTSVVVSDNAVRNLPPAYAPNVYPTAPCVVGTSAGGTGLTFGLSFGLSHRDKDCTRRETARTLASLGEVAGAIAIMCQDKAVHRAMPGRCDAAQAGALVIVPIPVAAPAPVVAPPALIVEPAKRASSPAPKRKQRVARKARAPGCK